MSVEDILTKFSKSQDSLVLQHSDFSLSAITDMVASDSIDITPHYQRRDRWSQEKQSALIESFLINVPVPPVYLSEDQYGTYSVIDGKQRITAIYNFLKGELKLKNMKEFPELDNSTFQDLPTQLKNALSIRPYIRVITLLKQSDPELKYEVFLRLNTGGEKLKPQEIRNVAYSGPFNDLLFELSENEFLQRKLKITSMKSTPYRNMDDIEHVLRYFTIKNSWKKMGAKISIAMDNLMLENRYSDTKKLKNQFLSAIKDCEDIWGKRAFQKPNAEGWREQLISPLYDAQMVAVSEVSKNTLLKAKNNKSKVIKATKNLYKNNEIFVKSVSQSTGDASAIKIRVEHIIDMLKNIED